MCNYARAHTRVCVCVGVCVCVCVCGYSLVRVGAGMCVDWMSAGVTSVVWSWLDGWMTGVMDFMQDILLAGEPIILEYY